MAHLHWLVPGPTSRETTSLKNSFLASIRLRCFPSICAANGLGWEISFGENVPPSPSVVIVGKIGSNNLSWRKPRWIEQMSAARKTARIYIDYTDHHLGFESEMSDFYRQAISLIDGAITPSSSMNSLLSQFWAGPIACIQDPFEVELNPPKLVASAPVTLLWFGHSSNMQFLIDFLGDGFRAGDQIRLIVLSNEAGLEYFMKSQIISAAKIEVQLAIWSSAAMVEAAMHADACIIPSSLTSARKIGVSSNRLLTALALGLPVAADNILSYLPFSKYYCDIRSDKFRNLLKNPLIFKADVEEAQVRVLPSYSLSAIEKDWEKFLKA